MPLSILDDKLKLKNPLVIGKPTVLSRFTENLLVHSLIKLGESRLDWSGVDIRWIVSKYFKDTRLQGLFQNRYPSNYWFYGFMKRQPNLSYRRKKIKS